MLGGWRKTVVIVLVCIFLVSSLSSAERRKTIVEQTSSLYQLHAFLPQGKDSPANRISEADIKVYNQRILIEVEDAILARFTDTRSMEPVIDKNSNAIEIKPQSMNEIKKGDIISYKSAFSKYNVLHRVVEKGFDEQGPYLRAKGDNLDYVDPEKIRFEQVDRVVVGILY